MENGDIENGEWRYGVGDMEIWRMKIAMQLSNAWSYAIHISACAGERKVNTLPDNHCCLIH